MPETLDLSMFVKHYPQGIAHMDLAVEGVGCAGCIRKIEDGLKKFDGVVEARLNFTNRRLAVDWREADVSAGDVIRELNRIGYASHPFRITQFESEDAQRGRWLMRCLAVAGFAAMNIMLLSVSVWSGGSDMTQETRDFFHWLSALIALPTAVYAGQPFFRSAWQGLRSRQLTMDVPISIGVVLALSLSLFETANHAEHAYFDSAVMLLFFLLCGRYLDHAMRKKTRTVATNLAALKAEVAHRFDRRNEVVTVPASALRPGDRLLVRPGERVPADAIVISGTSEIDESLVTGETMRRAVGGGAAIYGGSLNFFGALTVRVTAAEGGTLIDEVQRLLDKAMHDKSRIVQLADRAAKYYAPVVHTAAALAALGWLALGSSLHDALIAGIAVLIITCPCALALAIPVVQVVASGTLFRAGVILNSGTAIERLAEVDTIVFDKTGTLTLPEPRVVNAASVDADVLESAARLALSSRHPLALTLAREARMRMPWDDAVEEPGRGVRAIIGGAEARLGSAAFCEVQHLPSPADSSDMSTLVYSYRGHTAVFEIRQQLRPDAVNVIRSLARLGIDMRLVSGDREDAVLPIAELLGIWNWQAGAKPAEKIELIEMLRDAGHRVMMVGDGINDAPALAAAHVSLSPIEAGDLAQAQADALFLGDRLTPVLEAILVARKARSLMRQNLWLAMIYNAVAVPIAIAGLVTPLVAALAMSGSSILVTLNALRARTRPSLEAASDGPSTLAMQTRVL